MTNIGSSSEIWAIDLDRTVLNTNKTFSLYVKACHDHGVDQQSLESTKAQIETTGGSFDVLSYVVNLGLSEREIANINADFVDSGQMDDLLYHDASPFLKTLDIKEVPNLILTYGSLAWQQLKLSASGLSQRANLVIANSNKGDVVAGWNTGQVYSVETSAGGLLVGESVVLIDDKASCFRGLPQNCRGFWLRRDDLGPLPSQEGEVPSNVRACTSLSELIEIIN